MNNLIIKPKPFFIFILLFFSSIIVNYSFAIDLDAPLQRKKITPKSEIIRGFSTMHDTIKNTPTIETNNRLKTMSDVINLNRLNNSDTEPFLLGAYFAGWVGLISSLDAYQDTIKKHGSAPHEIQNKFKIDKVINEAINYFKNYRNIQKKLDIDDDELLTTLNVNKKVLIPQIYKWKRLTYAPSNP